MFRTEAISHRIKAFQVWTVRFCAFILETPCKICVTELSYQTYHGWRCIDECDKDTYKDTYKDT